MHARCFNPNIPLYHPPNSAEGLHFSAFHSRSNNNDSIEWCICKSIIETYHATHVWSVIDRVGQVHTEVYFMCMCLQTN